MSIDGDKGNPYRRAEFANYECKAVVEDAVPSRDPLSPRADGNEQPEVRSILTPSAGQIDRVQSRHYVFHLLRRRHYHRHGANGGWWKEKQWQFGEQAHKQIRQAPSSLAFIQFCTVRAPQRAQRFCISEFTGEHMKRNLTPDSAIQIPSFLNPSGSLNLHLRLFELPFD